MFARGVVSVIKIGRYSIQLLTQHTLYLLDRVGCVSINFAASSNFNGYWIVASSTALKFESNPSGEVIPHRHDTVVVSISRWGW